MVDGLNAFGSNYFWEGICIWVWVYKDDLLPNIFQADNYYDYIIRNKDDLCKELSLEERIIEYEPDLFRKWTN